MKQCEKEKLVDLRKSEIRTESNKLVGYTVEFQNGKKGIGLITSQGRFLGGISIDYIVEAIERKPCIRIDKDIS
jgi:hypothetical protein